MERKLVKIVEQAQKPMELKKHVAVIHSSNRLSLLQRKIANALLFNAYPHMQDSDEHTINIGKLCQLIGYDSNDHKIIKRSLVNLLSTVLEWNLVDGDRLDTNGVWNASSIIADASIDGAVCTYSYSNKMRKLLHRPNIYGRLDMLVQAKFQSGYGLALYENCNRFQDVGRTPWFGLDKFRKLMGVEEGKYKIFRDFKTRVLDKAVEEVNKFSSLTISPQLRKQNRQVVSIQFLIKKQNVISIDTTPKDEVGEELTLSDILRSQFGFSIKQTKDTVEQYEEKYIREKISLIEASVSFKTGKVKNMAKYLLSALRDDYQPAKNSTAVKRVSSLDLESEKKQPQESAEQLTKIRRLQDKQLLQLFEQQPGLDRIELLKKFETYLTGMYQDVYFRDGLKNVLAQDKLCEYLRYIKHPLVIKLG